MIAGKANFVSEPVWYLGDTALQNVSELEILGITYKGKMSADTHVANRVAKARRAVYRYSGVGVNYPGLASDTKAYIWNTVGVTTLAYGI